MAQRIKSHSFEITESTQNHNKVLDIAYLLFGKWQYLFIYIPGLFILTHLNRLRGSNRDICICVFHYSITMSLHYLLFIFMGIGCQSIGLVPHSFSAVFFFFTLVRNRGPSDATDSICVIVYLYIFRCCGAYSVAMVENGLSVTR